MENKNQSSASLPHVWQELLRDDSIPKGTIIPTIAFGPGVTMTGALLRKV